MKFKYLLILQFLLAFLQAASAATTADLDATTNATWVRVLTLAATTDGESSRGQQTMMMNITALPEGGAKRRTLKSLENPDNYYIQPSPWTTLVIGQNYVSIPGGVSFDRAVRVQFDSDDIEFDALTINGVDAMPISSEQNFLSIHISDAFSNTREQQYDFEFTGIDADSIRSELEILTLFSTANLDYFLTIDKSTSYNYFNNVNAKQFNASTNEAFVVISGTGVIDGKYILDDNLGELRLLDTLPSIWNGNVGGGTITITGSINVPFQGLDHTIRLQSALLKTSSDIVNTPLQSIEFSGFTPHTMMEGTISTSSGVSSVQRKFPSDSYFETGPNSYFQIEFFASAQAAIDSYNIDSDLLDSDGDGYAAWRDDDDTNPSITQANGIYTLSSALTEIASLESQKSSLIAERDARPTQTAYDTVVAESNAKLTLDEVKDLRAGSTMIEVSNNEATIELEMHQSNDLQTWSKVGESISMTVPADSNTKFFRHAFSSSNSTDGSDSSDDTTLEFTFIGTNNHDFAAYYGNEAIISTANIPLHEADSNIYYTTSYEVIEWSSSTPIGGSTYGRPTVTVAQTNSLVGYNLKIRFFKYDSSNANNFSSSAPVLTIDGDALSLQEQTVLSDSGTGVASQLGFSVRVWKEAKP